MILAVIFVTLCFFVGYFVGWHLMDVYIQRRW